MKLFKRKNKLSKSMLEFIKILDTFNDENMQKPFLQRDIMPPATDAQLVVDCLCDLFLGEDWYVSCPMSQKQINTVILDNILYKYCKDYRKSCKKR